MTAPDLRLSEEPAAAGSAPEPLELLAALLRYPEPGYDASLRQALAALDRRCPEAARSLGRFAEAVAGAPLADLQELYTRTFDLNPICALEVGWHLYGENYERGRFLVRMRELLGELGLAESGELPDHLVSALPVLARLDDEAARSLARTYVAPALDKMLEGFEDRDNPFAELLRAARALLRRELGAGGDPAPSGAVVPHHRRNRS